MRTHTAHCGVRLREHSRLTVKTPTTSSDWRVLRCLASREQQVESLLRSRGIEACVPTGNVIRTPHGGRGHRPVLLPRPLFPTYSFVRLPDCPNLASDILRHTPFVLDWLRFGDYDATVPADELAAAVRLAQAAACNPLPHLVTGARVRISVGRLAGIDGILAEIRGTTNFCVNVQLLGRSVGIVADKDMIEAIS